MKQKCWIFDFFLHCKQNSHLSVVFVFGTIVTINLEEALRPEFRKRVFSSVSQSHCHQDKESPLFHRLLARTALYVSKWRGSNIVVLSICISSHTSSCTGMKAIGQSFFDSNCLTIWIPHEETNRLQHQVIHLFR